MLGRMRIAFGVLLIIGSALVGLVGWGRGAAPAPVVESSSTVTRAAQTAASALTTELESLRSRAKIAAGLEPLRAALNDRVDVATVIDLFATEDWWRPFREEAVASRLVVGDAVAHHGQVDLGTTDQSVVTAARRNQQAAEVVAVAGRPFILAAARVDLNIKGDPVIVLAMPLEPKTLEAVATRTKLSLVLTDGKSSLLLAGSESHRDFLEGLVRRVDTATVIDGQDRTGGGPHSHVQDHQPVGGPHRLGRGSAQPGARSLLRRGRGAVHRGARFALHEGWRWRAASAAGPSFLRTRLGPSRPCPSAPAPIARPGGWER